MKPTAIRPNKVDISALSAPAGSIAVSNSSSTNNTSSSKPGLISSTPSKNHANAAAVVAGAVVPNISGIVAPQAPPGGHIQTIIGPAFAAVAKQHPSEIEMKHGLVNLALSDFSFVENGTIHQSSVTSSSTTSSVPSGGQSSTVVAPNASGAAVSNLSQIVNASQPTLSQQLQQAQQQQQQQQTNLASSLLTNAATVVAGGNVPPQPTPQQSQQLPQQVPGQNSIPLPHGGALTSASSGIENNHVMTTSSASTISSSGANIINNCVSPSNSAVSSRYLSCTVVVYWQISKLILSENYWLERLIGTVKSLYRLNKSRKTREIYFVTRNVSRISLQLVRLLDLIFIIRYCF